MIEPDVRTTTVQERDRGATVAYVPNGFSKYAGYLYLLADADGPVVSVPGIVGGLDDCEPDAESAEALIGRPIGRWELRPDGWYAEIR